MIGETIAGKYRVLELLGKGGFGSVYLVEIVAGMIGERLALKVLSRELSEDERSREQFLNEIRVAMRLVDKHIIQLRDVGATEAGDLYYTMDFSPGRTLREVLKDEGVLEPERAVRLARPLLRALRAAHAQNVIHRDLKPANLMVERAGDGETVRVLDFGIATAVRKQPTTERSLFAGSFHYTPPEQLLGQGMGFYTDLYAVGVILYECVTGQKPYRGATPKEVFLDMKSRAATPAVEVNPALRSEPVLVAAIMKALERNPERRYQTAKEFLDDLDRVGNPTLDEAPESRGAAPAPFAAPIVAPSARRPRRRRSAGPGPAVISVAAAVAVLAAVGLWLKSTLDPPRPGTPPAAPPEASELSARRTRLLPAAPGTTVSPAGTRTERAEPDTEIAPVLDPLDAAREEAARLLDEATAHRDAGRLAEAVAACAGARDAACSEETFLDIECRRAERLKGLVELESERYDDAIVSLESARARLPANVADAELHIALAEALWAADRKESALELLRERRLLFASDAAVFVALLSLLERDERDEELIPLLESVQREVQLIFTDAQKDRIRAMRHKWIDAPRLAAEKERREREARKRSDDLAAARTAFDARDYRAVVAHGEAHFKRQPDKELGLMLGISHRQLGDFTRSDAVLKATESASKSDPRFLLDVKKERGHALLDAFEKTVSGGGRGSQRALSEAIKAFTAALELAEGRDDVEARDRALLLDCRARCFAHQGKEAQMQADLDAADEVFRRRDAELAFHQGASYYYYARRTKEERALTRAISRLEFFNDMRDAPEALLGESYHMQGLAYYQLKRRRRDYINARNKFIRAKELGVESEESQRAWQDCDEQLKS